MSEGPGTTAPAAQPAAEIILARQLEHNFRRLPAIYGSLPFIGGAMTWVFLDVADLAVLGAWWAALCGLSVLGFYVGRRHHARVSKLASHAEADARSLRPSPQAAQALAASAKRWALLRVISAGAAGVLIGGVGNLLLPSRGEVELLALFSVMVAGCTMVGIFASASHLPSLGAFLVCNVGPLATRVFDPQSSVHQAMGGFAALFLGTSAAIGWQANKAVKRQILLQLHNEQLVADLEQAQANLRQANRQLELRVDERTRDLKRALADKEVSEAALRQSQKMEAVGQLAGGVAHDFNNLLTIIMGFAGYVQARLPGKEGRDAIEHILGAAERAAALVRQLLTFSRRTVEEPERFDVNTRVRELERMLRRVLGENIQLTCEIDAEPRLITMDPSQFDQILLNLAVNARDAMREGGRIWVTVTEHEQTDGDGGLQPGKYVKLIVQDSGTGIDDALLDKIFEPFFTTKGQRGTGLGLATTLRIVERNQGSVRASNNDTGARFEVLLPIDGQGISSARRGARAIAPLAASASVLVVEDQRAVRQVISRTLSEHGYVVHETGSAAEALAMLESLSADVDLVLTDIMLSESDGLQLRTQVLERWPSLPFLFISGYFDEEQAKGLGDIASLQLLRKPFTSPQLLAAVNRALPERHFAQRVLPGDTTGRHAG